MSAILGIAIVTYQRPDRLRDVIERLIRHTLSPFVMVVAEDGGDDGAVEWCRKESIPVFTGENRGVCWNKNRGLFALRAAGCDPLFIVEDDIYPVKDGWDKEWVEATQRWDHLAYAHPKIAEQIIEGAGTPASPYVNNKATAQCTSVSAEAVAAVGYFDTRFEGYGVGHAEWTTRIKRAGYGFKWVELGDGRRARANLYIEGGLYADDAPSFRNNEQVAANRELFQELKSEPLLRMPWKDQGEQVAFLNEHAASVLAHGGAHATPALDSRATEHGAIRALVEAETALSALRMASSE